MPLGRGPRKTRPVNASRTGRTIGTTLRASRSSFVRLPLDIRAPGSQEAGDASRGTAELIVIRLCSSKDCDLLSVDSRRKQPTT